jgi:hypothetical protein
MSVKLRLRRLEESQKAKADEVSYWIKVNAEAKAWIRQQVKRRSEHEQSKKPIA